MALDDLKETIEMLRERIQAHRPYLEGYETRTRQALIDPMLRTLGWDVENPDSVELEYGIKRKWADYALMGSGGPIAVIEAKALGTPLNDDEKMQALNYANMDGIDYMAVTNGDHWQMFDVFKRGQLDDRILMEFQLTRDEPYACALQALGLWRPNLASDKPQEAVAPVVIKPSHDESEPATPEPNSGQEVAESSKNGDWMPLTSLKAERGQKPPAFIKFSNSSPKPIKSWTDLLESIAKHLIETDKLSAQDCPVPIASKTSKRKSKRYLVHTKPIPPNYPKRKIGNELWLLTHYFDIVNMYKNACWLLENFGVNPSTVLVSANRS